MRQGRDWKHSHVPLLQGKQQKKDERESEQQEEGRTGQSSDQQEATGRAAKVLPQTSTQPSARQRPSLSPPSASPGRRRTRLFSFDSQLEEGEAAAAFSPLLGTRWNRPLSKNA